jgi:hypothetical protein
VLLAQRATEAAREQRTESEEARYVVAYQQVVAEALKQCRFVGGAA